MRGPCPTGGLLHHGRKENDLTVMWKELSLGYIEAEPIIFLEEQRKGVNI